MSLDPEKTSTSDIALDIPDYSRSSSSSVDSSLNSSPAEDDDATSFPEPTETIHPLRNKSSIKFAPLPDLGPRTRRSTAPLGIAARSEMMRLRREHVQRQRAQHSPMWGDDEVVPAVRRHQAKGQARLDEDATYEDPFMAIGKAVKHAWRRVAHKTKQQPEDELGQDDTKVVRSVLDISRPNDDATRRLDQGDGEMEEEEEGRVWEEEVGEMFQNRFSQTETLIDGRGKYSRTKRLDIIITMTPATPTQETHPEHDIEPRAI